MTVIDRIASKAKRILATRSVRKPYKFTLDSPIVSFTFDDFPITALDCGGRLLEDANLRGTYYACLGLADTDSIVGRIGSKAFLRSSAERGHELGCHTYSHLDCERVSPGQLSADCARNAAQCAPHLQENFAFPYGRFKHSTKTWAASRFQTARAAIPGINRRTMDLASLQAVSVYSAAGIHSCRRHLEELRDEQGWLIYYTHDVTEKPSLYGCTPQDLASLIELCLKANIDVLPVNRAFERIHARVSAYGAHRDSLHSRGADRHGPLTAGATA